MTILEQVHTNFSNQPLITFYKDYGSFDRWPEMLDVYQMYYLREHKLNELLDEELSKSGVLTAEKCEELYNQVINTTFNGKTFKDDKELSKYTLLPEHVVIPLVKHAVYAALYDYQEMSIDNVTIN